MRAHTAKVLGTFVLVCIFLGLQIARAFDQQGHSPDSSIPPPSQHLEVLVIEAFTKMHSGWSTDEVLLRDELRNAFCQQCRKLSHIGEQLKDAEYCSALLHVRKRGGQLPKTTKRAPRHRASAELLAVAEIAARRLQEDFSDNTDVLLVNEAARQLFNQFVKSMLPDADLYLARRAAIGLRKARRLEPELVQRITNWKKQVKRFVVAELDTELLVIPERPGIYIFTDQTGYLYIGQAKNLRERLQQHLSNSDRKSLADYLAKSQSSEQTDDPARAQFLQLEIHVFLPGSPAEETRVRRAYESDLIRTRSPRFNLAP